MLTSVDMPLEARALSRLRNGRMILDQVDLTMACGQIVALLGANGCGKTTLLHCLAGCLRPTAGQVLWFGQSPQRRPASHRLVGLAAHEACLYSELSAAENLLFAARMYGVDEPQRRVEQLLCDTQLASHSARPAGRLSKGMRQRLSLARALVHAPPIVLLDEPFTGLDVASREWLEGWLDQQRDQGRAVCFTSHDEEQSLRFADQRFELCDGRVLPLPAPRPSPSSVRFDTAGQVVKARSA